MRHSSRPSRDWSSIAVEAPSGIGAVYSVAAIMGSQAAACSRRGGGTLRHRRAENFAISAHERSRSRYSASVWPSSNSDAIGDSGNR